MKTTIALIGALALALAVGAAGVLYFRSEAQEARAEATRYEALAKDFERAAEAEKGLREAAERVALAHSKRVAAARVVITQQKKETDNVIQQNPDWASQPVPDAVAERLRKYEVR
jgi:uncharacterized protein HemX